MRNSLFIFVALLSIQPCHSFAEVALECQYNFAREGGGAMVRLNVPTYISNRPDNEIGGVICNLDLDDPIRSRLEIDFRQGELYNVRLTDIASGASTWMSGGFHKDSGNLNLSVSAACGSLTTPNRCARSITARCAVLPSVPLDQETYNKNVCVPVPVGQSAIDQP